MDEHGRRHDLQRKAASKGDARELAEKLARDQDQSGGRVHPAERMTSADLADYCEKYYYKRAVYHDGRKAGSVRGFSPGPRRGRISSRWRQSS